jgi:alkaline phosphatase
MSRQDFVRSLLCVAGACAGLAAPAWAETHIRIMPPARATFAVGQQFDLRVEATSTTATAPTGLRVTVDGTDVTARNVAPAPGVTGPTAGPSHTANVLVRAYSFTRPGAHVIRATTDDGASAEVTIDVGRWQVSQAGVPRAKNIIFFLGDGMGIAHRTAARLLAHGVTEGRANGALAMDTMPVTGQVMTPSLNAVVTDSAPGMSAYSTGNKANNNQEGVFPDNTEDEFDNPRVEYIGAFLRRMRGPGFNVGLVTTADLTDATPAANAVHTAQREASAEIAARYFDERAQNGLTVLMGGGRRHFEPVSTATSRKDGRTLTTEFRQAGFQVVKTRAELLALSQASPAPKALLGLFHPSHMSVAFDKVGAARYSDELAQPRYADLRDQPMLDEMARAAIATLSASSPRGFYLLVEGASIDKRAHAADSERTIWDTIEFDRAVQVALDFAQKTNSDRDPSNDTLVIVTADHECGGLSIVGVGNERYAPETTGRATRDYVAVFRYRPGQAQLLNFFTNYERAADGYPADPDPSRKLLLNWAAAPDRFENWLSNRLMLDPAVSRAEERDGVSRRVAVANVLRDGSAPNSDNKSVEGQAVPGFLVEGVIENGKDSCTEAEGCAGDTSSVGHPFSGHTATDVVLSAFGPGAWQFTGTYENTAVFLKMLRATTGDWTLPGLAPRQTAPARR